MFKYLLRISKNGSSEEQIKNRIKCKLIWKWSVVSGVLLEG